MLCSTVPYQLYHRPVITLRQEIRIRRRIRKVKQAVGLIDQVSVVGDKFLIFVGTDDLRDVARESVLPTLIEQ